MLSFSAWAVREWSDCLRLTLGAIWTILEQIRLLHRFRMCSTCARLVLVVFRKFKWTWKLTQSAGLILVALSQAGNEETTKTRRVDFEYAQRLPVSFWSRFAMLANTKAKKRPKQDGLSRAPQATCPIWNVFKICPSRFGRFSQH